MPDSNEFEEMEVETAVADAAATEPESKETLAELKAQLLEIMDAEGEDGDGSALLFFVDEISFNNSPGTLKNVMLLLGWRESAIFYRLMTKIQSMHKRMEALAKQTLDTLTEDVIPDKLDNEGLQNISVKGIGRWQVSGQARCSVPEAHRANLQKWMKDNDNEALVVETINASTLKSWVVERKKKRAKWAEEQRKAGIDPSTVENPPYEIPEQYLSLHFYSKASLVKA